MNTQSSSKDIKKRFEKLFQSQSKEEQINHEAYMLHYRVMQLVERAMDEKGWNKKQLAQQIGKSQSYITQLFMGNKIVNLPMMALLQDKLGLEFKIEMKLPGKKSDENNYEKKTHSERSYGLKEKMDINCDL